MQSNGPNGGLGGGVGREEAVEDVADEVCLLRVGRVRREALGARDELLV
jgi:hypothetical protein